MKAEDIVIKNREWVKDYRVVNPFKAIEGKYEHQTVRLSPDNLEEV